jgi:two-component system sensor histidine kinase RegB
LASLLAGGVAHDLSTPLSTIAVAAVELERGSLSPDQLADVRLIRSEVDRCRRMLSQLAVDAIAGGEPPSVITVAALLTRLSCELQGRGRCLITIEAAAGLRVLRVPIRAAVLALRNMVTNGWQAMPAGGQVLISAAVLDDRLTISIEDSGRGMKAEVLARAFEPTFTTKPDGSGMGLGLFLARSIVARVGGNLLLASTPGVGTTAIVRLPLEAGR